MEQSTFKIPDRSKSKAVPIVKPSTATAKASQSQDQSADSQSKPINKQTDTLPPKTGTSKSSSPGKAVQDPRLLVPVAQEHALSPDHASSILPSQSRKSHIQGYPGPLVPHPAVNVSRSVWRPDIYSPSFVPSWLKNVNELPAMRRELPPLRVMDLRDYALSFLGSRFVNNLTPTQLPSVGNVAMILSTSTRILTPLNYMAYFSECVRLEMQAHGVRLSFLNRYQVELVPMTYSPSSFRIHVPGLKDNSPRVVIGDVVLLRQIIDGPTSFSGTELIVPVKGVYRQQDSVELELDRSYLFPPLAGNPICNVRFTIQDQQYIPLFRALTAMDAALQGFRPHSRESSVESLENAISRPTSTIPHSTWIRRALFPEETDGVMRPSLPQGVFDLDWVDDMMNYEQQKAINSIVNRTYGNIPFLISGPPGTGKTKTIVELTYQLLKRAEQRGLVSHILLCAPSDSAADTLALRLAGQLYPHELFRLNSWSRSFAEVPERLMMFSYVRDGFFSLPPIESFLQYTVVVVTCQDADILVQAHCTNADFARQARWANVMFPGSYVTPEQRLHWTALLVDEAAQATEMETTIPISVVVPRHRTDEDVSIYEEPIFVMAGDQHQLGPRLTNPSTTYSVSLFERLFSRSLYADHPLSRRLAARSDFSLEPQGAAMIVPPFSNLVRNYRSHPAILAVPSALYYNDTLIPEAPRAPVNGAVSSWIGWKARGRWPILFDCNVAPDIAENVINGISGISNIHESVKALEHVKSLLSHQSRTKYQDASLSQQDIAVISPFNAQVTRLRTAFRNADLRDVNIGPLEAFQGLESRVVILCTTRTRPAFVQDDQAADLGIIGMKRKFNVAITRAKEGLIIIGNPSTLALGDENWKALLGFCWRNGAWVGDGVPTSRVNGSANSDSDSNGHGASTSTSRSSKPAPFNTKTWGLDQGFGALGRRGDGAKDAVPVQLSRLERALIFEERVQDDSGNDEGNDGDVEDRDKIDGKSGDMTKIKGKKRVIGRLPDEEEAMWTAGLAAESVLR